MADLGKIAVFSEKAVGNIQQAVEAGRRQLQNSPSQRGPDMANPSTEHFIVFPVMDEDNQPVDVAAASWVGPALIPSLTECCVYRIDPNDCDLTGGVVVACQNPDNSYSREKVFNIFPFPIAWGPLLATRSAHGQLTFLAPAQSPTSTTTTTTGEPTTTTTTPIPNECSGMCYWEWDNTGQVWNLLTDECTPEPTTTAAPTTTTTTPCPCPATTTTTGEPCLSGGCIFTWDGALWQPPGVEEDTCPYYCPCETEPPVPGEEIGEEYFIECGPIGPTTTTTTTTEVPTTTTTHAPCRCLYPLFCGFEEGQNTHTYCTHEEPNQPPECTTTTCDCNTTTTTTPSPECEGCDWVGVPTSGSSWDWWKEFDGCVNRDGCGPCPEPEEDPFCNTAHTDCAPPPPPPPPPAPCTGSCRFIWSGPPLDRWYWISDTCVGGFVGPCHCISPSEDGSVCGDIVVTPCTEPDLPDTTTTTGEPCGYCYTSTTTTTPAPCDRPCIMEWNGAAWGAVGDPCQYNCPCADPPYDGTAAGDVAYSWCGPEGPTTTTTTPPPTTTTTTTAAPTGACCNCPAADGCVDGVTEATCEACGGEWNEDSSCEACFPPYGRCCDGENCSVTWEENCAGIWDEGLTCDDTPGICCIGAVCSETPKGCCEAMGGTFYASPFYECGVNVECPGGPTTTTTAEPTTTTTTTTTTAAPCGDIPCPGGDPETCPEYCDQIICIFAPGIGWRCVP